jgi:hypothetical protein
MPDFPNDYGPDWPSFSQEDLGIDYTRRKEQAMRTLDEFFSKTRWENTIQKAAWEEVRHCIETK